MKNFAVVGFLDDDVLNFPCILSRGVALYLRIGTFQSLEAMLILVVGSCCRIVSFLIISMTAKMRIIEALL